MQENSLGRYVPIAEAIARLLAPNAEVVVHDLLKGKIIHIANRLSKRRRGDSSLTDLAAVDLRQAVIGPYSKTNWDGRRLKSVSAVIHDRKGKPTGLLCINQDIEAFSDAVEQLSALISLPKRHKAATTIFPGDWRESINQQISAFLAEQNATLAGLTAEDLSALIAALDKCGVFEIRHTVTYVASVLSISRATMYQRLKTVRTGVSRRLPRKEVPHGKTKA
jgi:predicted transcriptional regulator YheO